MYDTVIIGCGPAGLTAGIYLLRANKKVLILEKDTIGGAITSSNVIENYPGFISISGMELMDNMYEQVLKLGGEIELEEAIKIEDGKIKKVITEDNTYQTKSIIIATGNKNRLLGLDKEVDYIGNGISFCVACDGAFYNNKVVAVIGGGNSAVTNALSLSDIAKKVYLIQNLDKLTAENTLLERIKFKKNIEIITNASVTKLKGNTSLSEITITKDNKSTDIKLDGMFISIGMLPDTSFIKNTISTDSNGYIISSETITSLNGIFVAGDCRVKKIRQLTTATSDGTIAAINAIEYLNKTN